MKCASCRLGIGHEADCPQAEYEPLEVTTFTDWYHQWMCPACGKEWRGDLIDQHERVLRRGELG